MDFTDLNTEIIGFPMPDAMCCSKLWDTIAEKHTENEFSSIRANII
jgi:hypothetical protein